MKKTRPGIRRAEKEETKGDNHISPRKLEPVTWGSSPGLGKAVGEQQALRDGGAKVWLLPAPKRSLTRLTVFSWEMRRLLAWELSSLCLNRAPMMSWMLF